MRPLIAGNWKMNTLRADGSALVVGLIEQLAGEDPGCDILLCPPFVSLGLIGDIIAQSPILLGAQDCHKEESGAYTGSISAPMLSDAGCGFVIVGHSERRAQYNETDFLVSEKARTAHENALVSIVCVGETLVDRDADNTLSVVEEQLLGSVPKGANAKNTVIAYEPVWAIGTGKTPTTIQIREVHDHLRMLLENNFADGKGFRILYGGSMNSANAGEILSIKNVNGGLVGGASLTVKDFWGICTSL
ncbi:MAG: triose-phosphate isomerase [Alphaproteobacteria bacterium]